MRTGGGRREKERERERGGTMKGRPGLISFTGNAMEKVKWNVVVGMGIRSECKRCDGPENAIVGVQ